ncbi:hypothetical protein HFK74_18115|uniref:hypothetical protein n=1 Tax=Pseudomonas sp. SbOxS1 TaxID=2723884 RepID=UPI0015D36ADA|nr:hypothetical protein [Pseudomonas sp. SbOxS1]NYU04614.1 hypothetical protein [Pseudomonas sp. SbOxS1]
MLGYIFEVIKDEISYRREWARRAALPPPARETKPSPAEPSLGMRILSPPTGPTSSTAPLNNWSHPFGDRGNPLQQLTQLADAQAGYYPLGRNGMWHGGVHLDGGTTGPDALSQVRCLADGEVVAYRVPEHTPLSTFFPEAGGTLEAPFAAGLVLVRHRLQAPKIDGSSDDPPSLTFFSLYMHLEDWARYLTDPALPRPNFWPENPVLRVKPDVPDRMPGHPEQRGANVRHNNHQGQVIDFLPVGTPVTISGNGDFRKLENSCGPSSLLDEEGALLGYVSFSLLAPIAAGRYRVNVIRDPLIVREEPDVRSAKIGELQKNTEVTISGEGEFRKLESIAHYISFKSLQSERKPLVFDGVVVLDQPAPIKAGELIGHLGRYQECDETAPQQKLHLEVFSNDDVQAFFAASRAWAQRLPDTNKTWLKLAKGTPVAAHQDRISSSLFPIWNHDNPRSDSDLLVPKSLLDGLPSERKIQVPTAASGKTYNWYRLDDLLHDADGKPLNGWVREEVGVTPWVSPWSWEGHEVLYNYALPQLSLSYLLSVTGVLGEESKDRLRERAQKWDKGRMQTRLYEIIDRDRNGKMTADELQGALRVPALAQALAQLVIFSESEWNYRQSKWDALDEVLGHTNSAPILNWVAEKQRIKQLSWWGEVAGKVGLPKEGMVFHFHPVGLLSNFTKIGRLINVEDFLRQYEQVHTMFLPGTPSLTSQSRKNLEKIIIAINDFYELAPQGTNIYEVSYMLATVRHEAYHFTTREFFSEKPEVGSYSYFNKYDPVLAQSADLRERAKANGNVEEGDGYKYRGRGCVHLTWKNNYRKFSKLLSFDFVSNPDAAAKFEYSIPIMIVGMSRGLFTGRKLADYLNSKKVDYVSSRKIINGNDEDVLIASYAKRFETILERTSSLRVEFL